MSSVPSLVLPADAAAARAPFLSKARTVARPGFNRWLVPPAALAVHLCIGMAYGFSVFWLPLSRAVGVTAPRACPAEFGLWDRLFAADCDWLVSDLGWMYTLFFVFLGAAAALWGGWLEREGPRKAGVASAVCWCGGLLLAALGVKLHQLWLLWLGAGVIGGIGLGLGYISPVSTLIRWFPDRRGLATGLAIMGFGGGAMIGAPLADLLMAQFRSATSVGVAETLVVLAAVYFVFMLAGALGYRVPPQGFNPAADAGARGVAVRHPLHADVALEHAHRTPQFWLVWALLCLNVSAGIGVLGMAAPMLQEIFGGALAGRPGVPLAELNEAQRRAVAAMAAGFTGLLSLFNIGGRFFWASLSDRLGRRGVWFVFLALGAVLYALVPVLARGGHLGLCVLALCVILSMYGGGFATVPAYLADLFGPRFVGAIHGRLLTAWSTAGVLGPVTVNYLREAQLAAGVPRAQVYDQTMLVLAALLVLGLVANALMRPVARRWHAAPVEAVNAGAAPVAAAAPAVPAGRFNATAILAWAAVGLPLGWGLWVTLGKAAVLLR